MLQIDVEVQVFLEQVRAQRIREALQTDDGRIEIAALMRGDETLVEMQQLAMLGTAAPSMSAGLKAIDVSGAATAEADFESRTAGRNQFTRKVSITAYS